VPVFIRRRKHAALEAIMIRIALLLWTLAATAAAGETTGPMTQQRLHEIVAATGRDVRVEGNVAAFRFGEVAMLCISDPNADRMRIIHPLSPLTKEQVVSAIKQVAAARESFGDSYSSGTLFFR
jgi:hypothetical protein